MLSDNARRLLITLRQLLVPGEPTHIDKRELVRLSGLSYGGLWRNLQANVRAGFLHTERADHRFDTGQLLTLLPDAVEALPEPEEEMNDLTPMTQQVLAALLRLLKPDEPAILTYPHLADESGVQRSTLFWCIGQLRTRGLLVSERRSNDSWYTLRPAAWTLAGLDPGIACEPEPEAEPEQPATYEQALAMITKYEDTERRLLNSGRWIGPAEKAELAAIRSRLAELNDVMRRLKAARNGVRTLGPANGPGEDRGIHQRMSTGGRVMPVR